MELSAQGLHELAIEAFRIGNRGRLSLCDALRVLSETRLYLDLGFPSVAAYAGTFFQLRRAETFEYVRVAKALAELTALREAFGCGRIGWSALKAITRVASVESQSSWIDFASRNGIELTLAEARDAIRRGRNAPRESSYGLPNLDQKLVLRLPRSDMDKVRRWIEGACEVIAESTGAEKVAVEDAVLFLCERDAVHELTAARPAAGPLLDDDRHGEKASRETRCRRQIVYQRCPDCGRSRVGTVEGFVEIAAEEVDRHEGCAETVVIDGPTPPKLRRRILAREAGRCGNPRCRHDADHCHHLRFRSRGGKTCLENEVAVCSTCHALIHAGLLRVSVDEDGELRWEPVVSERYPGADPALDGDAADALPVLRVESGRGRSTDDTHKSAIADSRTGVTSASDSATDGNGLDPDALACGLIRLGLPAERSRTIIAAVVEALPRDELTEANVLRKALASISPQPEPTSFRQARPAPPESPRGSRSPSR